IAAVTQNRFFATIVGMVVTTLIQSSSITTVMAIGFVNSGVMTLTQSIGIIMGANIGTTITGWVLVLKVGKYGLPLLGFSSFIYLFSKGDRWRYWAMFFMGVGMVFFGLELMKDACKVIQKMDDFQTWFQMFSADTYFGVLKCAIIGCLLTMVVQSSSATLGITISLAESGIISYPTAAALVLGENIGTTITAYLASLGATTNARRAAYFHVIFNVLGVLWVTAIFSYYIQFIQYIMPGDVAAEKVVDGVTSYPHVTAAIAATHTVFNICNTLLFLPFVGQFAKLLERIVPSKTFKEKPHLTDLDIRMLETPLLAIEQSRSELMKMGDGCGKMLGWLSTLLQQEETDESLAKHLRDREKILDSMQDEISHFVTNLLAGNVPHAVADECRQQLRLADEYESISDYIDTIHRFDQKLRKDSLRFGEEQLNDLVRLNDLITKYVQTVGQAYRDQNENVLKTLDEPGNEIRKTIKRLRKDHLADLSSTQLAPQVTVAFLNTLNAYDRIRDHARNVAEVIAGDK
ncbi:MAG: Na/Pi cotransporter family protein, partial [Planctomycetaceae bacterium]|nr:Na/Pi cotransporter family protein [Planctomycetaceae bacterium]